LYWKFVCTVETEAECFKRALFGDTKKLWEEVKDVRKGDILFLYNIDTDVLFGPFIAESDGALNIEPDAWDGRFPAQVRVKWEAISILRNASAKFGYLKTSSFKPPYTLRLSEEQGGELLKALTPARVMIPDQLKSEIQQLDFDIHTLAHRMEEIMCGKGHLADREINLDRVKSEFIAKMRDFVWAVRKLDKQTGILELPSNK
jgi:hypothetical protein